VIERQYRVSARDAHMAEQILSQTSRPVFRLHGAMCEPATHQQWAKMTHERARLYGVTGSLTAR
jgi:citrate lyase beta subunit